MRPSSAEVSTQRVTFLGSDVFSDPGYELLGFKQLQRSASGNSLRLTVESRKRPGMFVQLFFYFEFEVIVDTPPGTYDLEVVRKHDDPLQQDKVVLMQRVVVP